MEIAVSLVVLIIGLLFYVWAASSKAQRVGEIMFACGLLAFLLTSVGPIFARFK